MDDTNFLWPPLDCGAPAFRFNSGLSVFFPAYNDAPSLPALLARTFATLCRIATDYEVIVVNDGSADNTGEVLRELEQKYAPLLRVITHAQNRGYGGALRSGLGAATKEFIFYTDGDGQYDPAEMEKLLAAVTHETGLVNGYKIERNDPWHRIAIGWMYNRFARWLFGIRLRDIDCDFRLIRRIALNLDSLRSTGGTICVELVRALETSESAVVELPVRHYPRHHGRSQFFRVKSLASTFVQLCALFLRQAPTRHAWLTALAIAALAVIAYGTALTLPFISDDYIQIWLGRSYGPVSGWPALAQDALYRCRATSLVLTYWIDSLFGLNPVYYNGVSLLLHIVNALLVFALGIWRPIGWRVAALAACFFAVGSRQSEAVVWFAAVPELLVFFFALLTFLFFVRWLQSGARSYTLYGGAFLCYLLALLSKESAVAVVPLCVLAVLVQEPRKLRRLWSLAPFAAVAAVYFLMDFAARKTHLHFNDGTFSLSAPFLKVLANSAARMIWFWGVIFLPVLLLQRQRRWRLLAAIAVAWTIISLLPYSFLTYMPRVPSRHTYLASVGTAILLAAGVFALHANVKARWKKPWMLPAFASLILVQHCGYLWTVKMRQYSQRAHPTEQLLSASQPGIEAIYANCFPYSPIIAEVALRLHSRGKGTPRFVVGPEAVGQPAATNFCNSDADGVHY